MRFIKTLWSPFKPFKLKFYCGKVAIGVPYFFPRRWVYYTEEEAIDFANNKLYLLPEGVSDDVRERIYKNLVDSHKKTLRPAPKKIGFDFVDLGWKTKWSDTDYRFEWAPVFSFVFFGYQLAITISAPEQDHYWEAWLYYEYNTDKNKSWNERIEQCRKGFPLEWTRYTKSKDTWETEKIEKIDYYNHILKSKYLK